MESPQTQSPPQVDGYLDFNVFDPLNISDPATNATILSRLTSPRKDIQQADASK